MFAWIFFVELNHSWAWNKLIEKERVVGEQKTLSVTTHCFLHLLWLLTQNSHKQPLRCCLEREKSNMKLVQSKQIKFYLKWAITKMHSCSLLQTVACSTHWDSPQLSAVQLVWWEKESWSPCNNVLWTALVGLRANCYRRYEIEFSSFGICSGLCLHWIRHCISLLWCKRELSL